MPEYCEKKECIKAILEAYEYEFPTASGAFDEFVTKIIPNILKAIPAADVAEVVHGHWICTNIAYGEYKCSVCEGMDTDCSDYYGNHNVLDQEYCPWCGAKMDEHNEPEN